MSRRMPKLDEINKWNGYVDSVKDVIVVEDTATEIGGDLEVDGVLTINDIDGGTNGQVLTKVVDGVSESVEWKTPSGGTQLYGHQIKLKNSYNEESNIIAYSHDANAITSAISLESVIAISGTVRNEGNQGVVLGIQSLQGTKYLVFISDSSSTSSLALEFGKILISGITIVSDNVVEL